MRIIVFSPLRNESHDNDSKVSKARIDARRDLVAAPAYAGRNPFLSELE
jgi:hypothetical protein